MVHTGGAGLIGWGGICDRSANTPHFQVHVYSGGAPLVCGGVFCKNGPHVSACCQGAVLGAVLQGFTGLFFSVSLDGLISWGMKANSIPRLL